MSEPTSELGGARSPPDSPGEAARLHSAPGNGPAGARELFARQASKDGRPVAVLRAFDQGASCVVEAEVYTVGDPSGESTRPGPYVFPDARQATAFVSEAVEALMYLGCEVEAQ